MKIITDKARIEEMFRRGTVVEVLPSKEELMKRMLSGERLKIYIGADPTGRALHLGHAKNYLFLEEMRQLGHEVIVLVGDFTAQIGDPTGRSDTRTQLTPAQVKENVKGWVAQLKSLLDFKAKKNPARLVYNSKWLAKLTFQDVLSLAAQFTVQQMLERDMFQKRLKDGSPIHLHEFLYPLMQGYDSVALDVDAELCGTDQTFNALAGRTLLKRLKNKDKFVIALNLMSNPKTGEMMSKSKGSGIFLSAAPEEMYGAVMAQPDEMTEVFLLNVTRVPMGDISKILSLGPRDAKARAAFEIVKKIHGEKAATRAEQAFNETFQKRNIGESAIELRLKGRPLVERLIEESIIASKSEWRRLVESGAVQSADGTKIISPNFQPKGTVTLKIGKRRFVNVKA